MFLSVKQVGCYASGIGSDMPDDASQFDAKQFPTVWIMRCAVELIQICGM